MNIDSTVKILEILKWPIVTTIIGIIAVLRLTPYLGNLLNRITKISKDGLEAGKIKDQAHQKQITAKDLMKIFDNRLLLETEDLIKSDLGKILHDSAEEKETLLIKLYASEKIARCFDQTYNFIFGSQINALQHLNSFAGRIIDRNEIKSNLFMRMQK